MWVGNRMRIALISSLKLSRWGWRSGRSGMGARLGIGLCRWRRSWWGGGNKLNVTKWDCGDDEWGGKEEERGEGLVTGYFLKGDGACLADGGECGV